MTQTATSGRHRDPDARRKDLRSGARGTAGRRTPLGRLRDNAALLGTILASAGLLMGAVAPPTPPARTGDRIAEVAPAPAPDPAVTASAEASVIFDYDSTGPAKDGLPPEVVRARALSGPLPPALADRRPFGGPVEDPKVSSRFGYRVDPLDGYRSELHTGQDYASACGTPVRAADAGTVVDSGWHAYGGGLRIVVDHGAGLTTTYNHLSTLEVPAGTAVHRGQTVGAVGSSGNSTGCHLHFEVLIGGEKVDPQPWL
ncbi:M23 family metallopeptidase [Arthrobacter sp. Ld5]|uniref:M23 family metallopeptidase n=1 Tax=Arthrobacter sp. Ld5 TaxID=649152 RepID=UPI003EBC64E6